MHGVGVIEVYETPISHGLSNRWVARVVDTTDMGDEVVEAVGRTRGEALVHLAHQIDERLSWWPQGDKIDVLRREASTCR